MKLLVGSTNRKKLAELEAMAASLGVAVVSPRELGVTLPEVVEDGATFAENAAKKAVAFARASGLPCVADDSGLCVDALGGDPGVRSARYSGEEPRPDRDERNNGKLLRALRDVQAARRTASFRCALALARPDGRVQVVEGRWDGRIAFSPRGSNGFGYDPLFVLDALGRTSAELTAEEKNARSHRGQAMRLLRPLVAALARGE